MRRATTPLVCATISLVMAAAERSWSYALVGSVFLLLAVAAANTSEEELNAPAVVRARVVMFCGVVAVLAIYLVT